MRLATAVLLALLVTAMTLHAERFFLIDESGTEHGPYEITHDGTLTLDGQTYRIRVPRIEHREHEIFQMMQKCRIPEVDFRQADIRDVVDFLHKASIEFWPDDSTHRRGISVVLRLDDAQPRTATADDHGDPFATDPFAPSPGERASPSRLITFSALDITLLETFEIICELAGLEMSIPGSKLMLTPAKQPPVQPPPASAPAQP